ncbi:MAG: polysaccharide deacetylase family protein [Flavobacteriales bacterium]
MSWFLGLAKRIYPRCLWVLPRDKAVYLTFDDGPHPVATPIVLQTLKKHNVKATFFCVGNNIKAYPKLYEAILFAGHTVGNHTFNHENGWNTSSKNYLNSVLATRTLCPSTLFRPPYGKISIRQRKQILKLNFKIIMWSWISQDYNNNITNQKILNSLSRVTPGDILVFHDNDKTSHRIGNLIEHTIDYLKAKNFTLEPINEHEI